ncbi:hypothetical protein ACH4LN_14025 [Streptomyces albus]|uniref:Uncharacterized protein n=1 Tax=Streptomyces albus TaxID=1888 RepID=A0A8H1LI84_9ACTN|nr:hypothetical protein [Streptomyces albus]TGG84734.1 hypothetical protein D8771_12925 [Streptomyces albus]UVN56202.1 hypothetical protein NR995_18030 [Streptomyces albus]
MAEWKPKATPRPEHQPKADQFEDDLVALSNEYGYELWGEVINLLVRESRGKRTRIGMLPRCTAST